MFPGIYGFHWSLGHLIFLGAFYLAVTAIAVTLVKSLLRSRRDLRAGKAPLIRWQSDFHDLPERSRRCRHELNGEVAKRECPNGFDCRECVNHAAFGTAAPAGSTEFEILGITVPLDRRYHRGQTWVRGERDGTFTVGLNPLAARLVGTGAKMELPEEGTELTVNGPAWRIGDVRILSPVNGRVVARSEVGGDWVLKVAPAEDSRTTHLLSGSEVENWMKREVERFQIALSGSGAVLADGGSLMENPGSAYPREVWGEACGEMFLDV